MCQPIRCYKTGQLVVLGLAIFFSFFGEVSAQAIVANIPVSYGRADKAAVNPATNRIYVGTGWGNTNPPVPLQIVVIDGATNTPITSIDTNMLIARIVVNSTTNRIYALVGGEEEGNRVMVIDGATNQIINVFDIPEHTRDIAVNPITNRIHAVRAFSISSSAQQFQTIVIDGSTGNVIGSTPFIYGWGNKIAVNPTTNLVYVLNASGSDALIVFNGDTNALETTISYAELSLGGQWGIAVNPVTNQIYVLGSPAYSQVPNGAVVAVVDGNTHAHVASLAVGNTRAAQSFAVNSTTNRIYVIHGAYWDQQGNTYDIVTEFEGGTNSLVSRMTFYDSANAAVQLAVNSQSNRLFINRGWNFLVIDPADITPPVLSTFDLTTEATSGAGAMVYYPQFATDNSNVAPALQCNIPSGSGFPIGTTTVSCMAVDTSGNTSLTQSFQVSVADTTPPNLSLPETIFTDATSASGATVNYVASANDAVSGDLPITCSRASGSVFSAGETTITCTATDGANNTSSGEFKVFVLTPDQEVVMPGYDVPVTSADSGISLSFAYVDQPGVTTIAPIDPASIGTTPSGFAVSDIAYEISTTSAGATDYGVLLAFVVPNSANMSRSDFELLRVLHNNNGTLEDVTSGHDFDNRIVYAYTYSFSPFYLGRRVTTNIETLFDRSTAYKAGSTIPVKIRVRDGATNTNLSSSTLTVTARSLKWLSDSTALTANDSGSANPDTNFRYLGEKDGGSYIFNLSTKGLASGQYVLSFYVGSDRSFFYTVKFEIK